MTKITCISDMHGSYPRLDLPGGDLLIIAGDCTGIDTPKQWDEFFTWLHKQKYKKKVMIAGNHDNLLQNLSKEMIYLSENWEYLCDSGTEVAFYPDLSAMPEGTVYTRPKFKIWGSPWTFKFQGMNPSCAAFTVDTEEEMREKMALVPDDTDILITHCPPALILDEIQFYYRWPNKEAKSKHAGSYAIRETLERVKPKLHIFGHIHEHGCTKILLKQNGRDTWCVNAAVLDQDYRPHKRGVIHLEM